MIDITDKVRSKHLFDDFVIKKFLNKSLSHDFSHFFVKLLLYLFQGFFFTEMFFWMLLRCLFHRCDMIKS